MKQQTNWLKTCRERIDISQEDLAARLQVRGFNISRASLSHWENGRHDPPLQDAQFRLALADALKINVKTLLKLAGYEVVDTGHSDEAERIAHIVDALPPDKRDLALRLIEQLAKTS